MKTVERKRRITQKTVRSKHGWVKITRDNYKRMWTFALGRRNDFVADHKNDYSFGAVRNWREAQAFARVWLNDLERNYV